MNNSPKRRTTIMIDLAEGLVRKHDGTIVKISQYDDLELGKVGEFIWAQAILDTIIEEAWNDGWEPCGEQNIIDIYNKKKYLPDGTTLFTQTLIRRQADKFPTDTRDKGIYGANLSIGFEEMSGYSDADVAFHKAGDLL